MPDALLVMDVQEGIVRRYADDPGYLDRLQRAIATSRARNLLVVFVRVGFKPGHPEVSENNRIFSGLADDDDEYLETHPLTQVHASLNPRPNEPVVVKKRVSAFTGSDLELVLRSQHIDHLVLTGIATSGVVLSTLREAADRDYRLTVLHDACADRDPEVHRVLTEKVFPRQATVVSVDEWTRG